MAMYGNTNKTLTLKLATKLQHSLELMVSKWAVVVDLRAIIKTMAGHYFSPLHCASASYLSKFVVDKPVDQSGFTHPHVTNQNYIAVVSTFG